MVVGTSWLNAGLLEIELSEANMDLLFTKPAAGTGVLNVLDGCPNVKYAYSRGGVYCRWFDGQRTRVKSMRVPQIDVVEGRMDRIIQHAKCVQTFYNEFNVSGADQEQDGNGADPEQDGNEEDE